MKPNFNYVTVEDYGETYRYDSNVGLSKSTPSLKGLRETHVTNWFYEVHINGTPEEIPWYVVDEPLRVNVHYDAKVAYFESLPVVTEMKVDDETGEAAMEVTLGTEEWTVEKR